MFSAYKDKYELQEVKKYPFCTVCKSPIRTYAKDPGEDIRIVFSTIGKTGESHRVIFPHEVRTIFDNVTPDTLEYFGWPPENHPSKMVWYRVLVPPNTMRPENYSIHGDFNSKREAKLITPFNKILQINASMEQYSGQITDKIIAKIDELNRIVYNMVRGKSDQIDYVSISQTLSGKDGIIRGKLLGKRTNRIGRVVITCNNYVKPDEIGLSKVLITTLTHPEKVQTYNFERMFEIYQNGTTEYPGCTVIRKSGGKSYDIEMYKGTPGARLEIGDTLDRHILPGEQCIMNREPSLDTSSLTSLRAVMLDMPVAGMNVCTCGFFNADFDGDQMTLVGGAEAASKVENELISSPMQRFISRENGAVMISQVLDSTVGCSMLTMASTVISSLVACKLVGRIREYINIPEESQFTGKGIISHVLKSFGMNISLRRKSRFYDKNLERYIRYDDADKEVVFDNGTLVSGVLDKNTLGAGVKYNLFHTISNIYGVPNALKASDYFQKVAIAFLLLSGLSIGIRDIVIRRDNLSKLHDILKGIMSESMAITDDYYLGKIIPPPGRTAYDYHEKIQSNLLNLPKRANVNNIVMGSMDLINNSLFMEVQTGSKGNSDNFRTISMSVGQLYLNGARYPVNYSERGSPYFHRLSRDPRARGFIANQYSIGLTPDEFFMHAMESRLAIVTRALTTAVAGTKSRRMIKNMEGIVLDYLHRSYRKGMIVEQLYGFDGCDPKMSNNVDIWILDRTLTYDGIKKRIMPTGVSKPIARLIQSDVEYLRTLRKELVEINIKICYMFKLTYEHNKVLPIDIRHEVHRHKNTGKLSPDECTQLQKDLRSFVDNLGTIYYNDLYSGKIAKHFKAGLLFITSHIYCELNLGLCIQNEISYPDFRMILDYIRFSLSSALMGYGQAIGALCTQGLSNSLTQFVIDAHHRSGVGGEHRSLNIINEICEMRSSERMRNRTMMIGLRSPHRESKKLAHTFANKIRSTSLGAFVDVISGIIIAKYGHIPKKEYLNDNRMLLEYAKLHPLPKTITKKSIRMVLNLEKMSQNEVSIEDIVEAITNNIQAYAAYLIDNKKMVLYVYFLAEMGIDVSKYDKLLALPEKLFSINIRGIDGIKTAIVNEKVEYVMNESGEVETQKVHVISCEGSNLREILMLPEVDPSFTTCNVLEEIQSIYGVEIAKNQYIRDYTEQLGENIHSKHYNLVACEISSRGELTGINRSGSEARGASRLQLISDSAAIQGIVDSAITASYDELTGVSPYIMLSEYPPIGTTYSDTLMDTDYINEFLQKDITEMFDEFK